MLFDRPEIKKLCEQDREVLAKGKIDWISKILPIAKEIIACDDRLSDDDFIYYSRPEIKTSEGIIKTPEGENEWGAKIIEFRKARKERFIQAKRKLEDLITLISDKDRNDALEALANKIKDWEHRDLSSEEKDRELKIEEDNLLLVKAQFIDRLDISDIEKSEILEKAKGLVHRYSLPDQYPWKDVALSILSSPEDVIFDFNDCPYCGEKQIKLHFHSPKSTWARNCGVAGEMVICPKCQRQTSLTETVRN